jgi:hypothetical protein
MSVYRQRGKGEMRCVNFNFESQKINQLPYFSIGREMLIKLREEKGDLQFDSLFTS